jgi:orotidine-5'-phosphate decarboxylase
MQSAETTTVHFQSVRDGSLTAAGRLIVALDFPQQEAALKMAERLNGRVGIFKVGSELFTAAGPGLIKKFVDRREQLFLDLKFHDIPNTVRAAAERAAQLGVSMFTIHASGGRKMIEAVVAGARSNRQASIGNPQYAGPLVIAVTVLTSLAGEDLAEIGFGGAPEDAVVRLARLAQSAGADGVVASPKEIAAIREACGPKFLIVTPGIRPAASSAGARSSGAAADDQARVATPKAAIQAGADFLVVGRPITQAEDPVAAADAVVKEMEAGAREGKVKGKG